MIAELQEMNAIKIDCLKRSALQLFLVKNRKKNTLWNCPYIYVDEGYALCASNDLKFSINMLTCLLIVGIVVVVVVGVSFLVI
jgi:hypothetical protein